MVSRPSASRNPDPFARPSGHIGWLDTFLEQTRESDIWIKPIATDFDYTHERYRVYGVLLTSLLIHPCAPVIYATFRAALVRLGGGASLRFPTEQCAPVLSRFNGNVTATAEHLRATLSLELQKVISTLDQKRVLVLDAQWDVPDPWSGLSKGMEWRDGMWVYVKRPDPPKS